MLTKNYIIRKIKHYFYIIQQNITFFDTKYNLFGFYLINITKFIIRRGYKMKTLSKKNYIIILILLTFFFNFGLMVSAEETIKYLDCNIVSKISNDRYEIIIDNADNTHALLETVETNFTSRGQTDILVKKIREVEITLNNGFKETWDLYREIPDYSIKSYNYLYNIKGNTDIRLIGPLKIKKLRRDYLEAFYIEGVVQNTGDFYIDRVSFEFEIYETDKLKNKITTLKSSARGIKPNGVDNLNYASYLTLKSGKYTKSDFKNFVIKVTEKSGEKSEVKWTNYKNENLVNHIDLNISPSDFSVEHIIDKNRTIYLAEQTKTSRQHTLKSIGVDGIKNWSLKFSNDFSDMHINNNTLYGASNETVYAINLDGEIKWKKTISGFNSKFIIDNNGNIYIAVNKDERQYLIKFDVNGNKKGEYLLKDEYHYDIEDYIYDKFENKIYILGRDDSIHAFNVKGELVWIYKGEHLSDELSVNQNMIISGDSAIDKNGDLLWKSNELTQFSESTIKNNMIFSLRRDSGDRDYHMFVLDKNGDLLWENKRITSFSKVIIKDASIFIIGEDSEEPYSDEYIFALDFNGNIKWRSEDSIGSNLLTVNENTFIYSDYQSIVVINNNGKVKWSHDYRIGENIIPLLVNNNNLFYINYENQDEYNNGLTILNLKDSVFK